jgi:hypothetical protein
MGGVATAQLLWLAFGGDAFIVCALVLGLSVTESQIYGSGFFIIGADLAAGLVSFLHALACPLISFALLGLSIKTITYGRRVPTGLHILYATESIAAAGIGLLVLLLLSIVVLDFALWVLIVVAVIMVCIGVLAAMFGAASRS